MRTTPVRHVAPKDPLALAKEEVKVAGDILRYTMLTSDRTYAAGKKAKKERYKTARQTLKSDGVFAIAGLAMCIGMGCCPVVWVGALVGAAAVYGLTFFVAAKWTCYSAQRAENRVLASLESAKERLDEKSAVYRDLLAKRRRQRTVCALVVAQA